VQRFAGPGIPMDPPQLLPLDAARALVVPGDAVIESPLVDIVGLARFGAMADPALFPPEASYVRDADAKPQEKFRVARVPETAP
jgi:hypothetical protein